MAINLIIDYETENSYEIKVFLDTQTEQTIILVDDWHDITVCDDWDNPTYRIAETIDEYPIDFAESVDPSFDFESDVLEDFTSKDFINSIKKISDELKNQNAKASEIEYYLSNPIIENLMKQS